MTLVINQNITIYCIKDVMHSICIVFTSIDSSEAQA